MAEQVQDWAHEIPRPAGEDAGIWDDAAIFRTEGTEGCP